MNKPSENTYIAPINLVFLNHRGFRNIQQTVECQTGMAPLRKHTPVITALELEVGKAPLADHEQKDRPKLMEAELPQDK